MGFRIGMGTDLHRLGEGNGIMLGGIAIPCPFACRAASDGDVLLHALVDAMLGACGKGDIGEYYDENNVRPGEGSARFVLETAAVLADMKMRLVNVDCVVNLERPKLSPWKSAIRDNIASLLALPPNRVNVKAKTGEGVGPIGEGEAVSAAVAVLAETDA